jgi:hypothetical protein
MRTAENAMHRDIVWEWADRPGLEHLSLDIAPDGIGAHGLVVVALDGRPVRLRYSVRCDAQWVFREASLAVDLDGTQRNLALTRDANGQWRADGGERADLGSCTDIDIMTTPFTNTLPIRRLALPPDAATVIRVVYIRIPELSVEAFDQEYTRLDPATPPRRFRYRSLASGFTAELAVDADGLVIEYPGLWHRRRG